MYIGTVLSVFFAFYGSISNDPLNLGPVYVPGLYNSDVQMSSSGCALCTFAETCGVSCVIC